MILEELIHKRFVSSESLIKHLARYDGIPAIFSPEAPDSKQDGWGDNTQYPRVVYNFDLQANEERHSAGTLSVSLYCQNVEEMMPEVIEPEVRQCLKDVLLYTDDEKLYAFAWNRTDAFEIKDKKVGLLIGSDIRFDILEYTNQETTDPDPIVATNQYIKKLYPDCVVIGLDKMQEITEATAEQPVIYCRLVSTDKAEETNTVAWMDGKIAIHILCPDSEVRMKIGAAIAQKMSLDGEIIMLDYSPMFIKRLQANYKSDYLKDGQIFVTGRYGILRYKSEPHTIRKINIEC
ncbi:MAG: hypothetical protein K2N51_15550 [Lachnospiraceae bacterium]|nr:hypothetical protein [Lachnospiraceae bacterium]